MSKTQPKYQHHCLRCDQVFHSRSQTPVRCPKCQSDFWDTTPLPNSQRGAGRYQRVERELKTR